ncbi:MAG: hypothetical protein ACR2QH_03765 [Geminicoccaceae bacterium]
MTSSLSVLVLLLTTFSARADEFADIDPKQLARGVGMLAESWSIPAAVFLGATDDFAKIRPAPQLGPVESSSTFNNGSLLGEYSIDLDYGFISRQKIDSLLGAIERRRRLD